MKRDSFTLPLDIAAELLIDNFAGGGGASTGIEQAFGRPVDVAINHDGEALAMHAANHPGTKHYKEDVFTVHPGFVTRQQPIGLAWFSPDCKHHSKAKGGKPREKKIRGLAWVCLKWATFQMPRAIAIENVEEFQDWGPLNEEGKPVKAEKGRTFRAFIDALSTGLDPSHPDVQEIYDALGADFPMARLYAGLGYKVEWRILRACDYGTPTIRKRLFVFARRDGLPIVWPAPTHGDPKNAAVKEGKLQPYRTAAECIDWSIPCPSIFERSKPLKDATLRRIAKGIMKFVVNSSDPFIVKFSENSVGQQTEEPLHTVMAGAPRFGLVETKVAPFVTEHANASNQRVMPGNEPLRTQCAEVKGGHFALVSATLIDAAHGEESPSGVKRWGVGAHTVQKPLGAVLASGGNQAVVSAFLAKHYGGVTGTRVTVPFGTVTTSDHHSVVTSHLVKLRGTCQHGQPVDEPAATVSAQGLHLGEVRAFLIKYYGNEKDGNSPAEPLGTVPTHDRFGLVTVHGEEYQIVDIGMRMLTPRELARAQGFPDDYILDPIVTKKLSRTGKEITAPLSKTAQVRMIGNSVCPPLARALLMANFAHERQIAKVA